MYDLELYQDICKKLGEPVTTSIIECMQGPDLLDFVLEILTNSDDMAEFCETLNRNFEFTNSGLVRSKKSVSSRALSTSKPLYKALSGCPFDVNNISHRLRIFSHHPDKNPTFERYIKASTHFGSYISEIAEAVVNTTNAASAKKIAYESNMDDVDLAFYLANVVTTKGGITYGKITGIKMSAKKGQKNTSHLIRYIMEQNPNNLVKDLKDD